jgi:hypothetical protein
MKEAFPDIEDNLPKQVDAIRGQPRIGSYDDQVTSSTSREQRFSISSFAYMMRNLKLRMILDSYSRDYHVTQLLNRQHTVVFNTRPESIWFRYHPLTLVAVRHLSVSLDMST